MPTFDFQCRKCNHIFEFSRPFGSVELPSCTACGSKRTEKLIAPPAVHFKGSGWYKNDSRGASTTKERKETAPEKIEGTKDTKGTEATKGGIKDKKVAEGKDATKGNPKNTSTATS